MKRLLTIMSARRLTTILAFVPWICFQAGARNAVTDSLEFGKDMAVSPSSLIRGKVSGVRVSSVDGNPNGVVNVNVRGVNTLRGDGQPLWIIDGAMIDISVNSNLQAFWQLGEGGCAAGLNPLAYLNPYDVESVEVLKDMSATAIYGSRGANGVIIVRTKSAKREDGIEIDWNSNAGVSLSSVKSSSLTPGFSHNHNLSISGIKAKTNYYLSAYYRNTDSPVPNVGSEYAGLRIGLDAVANPTVQFGLNTILSLGSSSNTTGTAWLGQSSFMTVLRGVTDSDSTAGWTEDYDDNVTDRKVDATFYLNVNLAKWLKWKTTLGVDYQNNSRFFWYGKGTAFGLANNGVASILGNSRFNENVFSSFDAERYFKEAHHLKVSLGGAQFYSIRKSNIMEGCDFFSHELRAKGLNLSAMTNKLIRRFQPEFNQFAVFAAASYDYRGWAGINVTLRSEFTPKYFDSTPVLYPAVDAFVDIWRMLDVKSEIVSALSIEGGYGKSGFDEYNPIFSSPYVEKDTEAFYDAFSSLVSSEWHVGLNAGFMSGRVQIAAAYYDKSTDDRYSLYCFGKNKPNTSKAGGPYIWDYDKRYLAQDWTSTISNRGVELDLDAVLISRKDLKWSLGANASFNDNSVMAIAPEDEYGTAVTGISTMNRNIEGRQVGAIYGTDSDTDVAGFLGNPIPSFVAGLSSELRAGNFTLDIAADAAAGFSILNLNRLVFSQSKPYSATSSFVEKGDFFRLSRVSVGYDIPFVLTKWIRSANVHASAYNLLTATSYGGYNPDVNSFGLSTISAGLDYGSFPLARTFVLGVSFKF